MKKFISLLFVLLLILSVAVAEGIPSKTTADLVEVKNVEVENLPADSNFSISVVVEDETVIAVANVEIAKLVEIVKTADVATYFGDITDSTGNTISLKEVLGTDTINVHEFMPIEVKEYEETYGKVSMNFTVSTPYAKGEKIIAMLGLVTVNPDSTQTVAWTAYDAEVVEDGSIKIEFEPETLKLIQESTTLLAIVSK